MKQNIKESLIVIFYIVLGIIGTVAAFAFCLNTGLFLVQVFTGEECSTYLSDPYLANAESCIRNVYLFGLFSLLSLVCIRKKRKIAHAGIIAVFVSAVVAVAVSYCVIYCQLPVDCVLISQHPLVYMKEGYEISRPTYDFSQFLKYAIQPAFIFAVCFTSYLVSKRKILLKG